MSNAPKHPYRNSTVAPARGPAEDVVFDPESLDSLHDIVWAVAHSGQSIDVLRGHEAAVERLVAAELAGLPTATSDFQESLALTMDPGLLHFAKESNAATAWAIADLTLMTDLDENALERAVQWTDPAGLIAPFAANASMQLSLFDHLRLSFGQSAVRARELCAGSMTFGLAEPHLRGRSGFEAPDLTPLAPATGLLPVALGALLRRLGLWLRISSTLPQMRQRMRDWLAPHADMLRTSFATAAHINEALRGSDQLDVFVLGILLECDREFGLEPAARKRLLAAAEDSFFGRFASALDRKDVHKDGTSDFRSFEFDVVEKLVTAAGLDAHRFEETFLGLAADGYFRSLAPEVYAHERSRAIYFVAIAALAAARTDDTPLLEAVRRCLKRLQDQRFGGAQLLPTEIVDKARKEAAVELPTF